ncbi:hypothetical protein CTI12_AA496330 [Artemisia annua]|uniref:Uncharacterized protein n=1 Tax=Artemisia annua TaxID=35608 RepID=A0A2U1LFM5_ARTAN|nr:hypothetical protein CTI12_AA496330 [Artemisia annua]
MEDTSEMPMDLSYRENSGSISVDPSVGRNNSSITTLTQSFVKEDESNKNINAFHEHTNALLMDKTTLALQEGLVQVSDALDPITKRKEQKATENSTLNNFRFKCQKSVINWYAEWCSSEVCCMVKREGTLCCHQRCDPPLWLSIVYIFKASCWLQNEAPNNHIYFDSGKTIYEVVQELRNTPQNVLFDVIQIRQLLDHQSTKNVSDWKDSFLAATP